MGHFCCAHHMRRVALVASLISTRVRLLVSGPTACLGLQLVKMLLRFDGGSDAF